MKTQSCLAVCLALSCWVAVGVAAPHLPILNRMSEIVEKLILKYNQTLNTDNVVYVDSARNFSQGPGRCGEKFFCVVPDILHKSNVTQHGLERELVGNLNSFIRHKKLNCPEVTKTPLNTTLWLPMDTFLSDIKSCVQCRTLNHTSTSC